MVEIEIKTKGYKCNKCGHEWIARKGQYDKEPALCPKCKSPYWNKDSTKSTTKKKPKKQTSGEYVAGLKLPKNVMKSNLTDL